MSSPTPDDEEQSRPLDQPVRRSADGPRRRAMTPDERRLLNSPKKTPVPSAPDVPPPEVDETSDDEIAEPEIIAEAGLDRDEARPSAPDRVGGPGRADLLAQTEASRSVELRNAILVICVLVLICGIFYAGLKFNAIRYHLMTRLNPPELTSGPDKFPGVAAEDLVESGLDAERRGDWQDAADRFIAAKRKDRALPGVLYRIGKSAFDRGDLPSADKALEHAIRFGENIAVASYYRGLIAVNRHDLPAATRFFEAASKAEPFMGDFYYFWGEALRLDQHPREAIKRYRQAVQRTPSSQDASLCRFKMRLAQIEAAESSKVAADVAEMRKIGNLSVDWLMTDAAIQLQAGNIAEAGRLITEARAQGLTGLFLTCAGDTLFRRASEAHPEIASLLAAAPSAE